MKAILLSAAMLLGFSSCREIAEKIASNAAKESLKKDSVVFAQNENPISLNSDEVLERGMKGEDSIYLKRQFYVSGEKYSDSWYRADYRDSISIFYYKSGAINHRIFYRYGGVYDMLESNNADGTARADKRVKAGNGNFKFYHPITYKLNVDCNFKDGYKTGPYSSWYANGSKHERCTFDGDKLVGEFTVWYPSGLVKVARKYTPATNTYTYNSFYDNGKPEACEIREGDSLMKTWKCDSDGNIIEKGAVVNGHMKSIKYEYHGTGKLLSRVNLIDGKKEGNYEYFYENGSKKAVEVYVNDVMTFESRWYESGKLSQTATYSNGVYHGWYRDYYSSGFKRTEQEYAMGVKQGQYKSYFDNGNLYYDGYFEAGKAKGEMKEYTRDGVLKSTKTY